MPLAPRAQSTRPRRRPERAVVACLAVALLVGLFAAAGPGCSGGGKATGDGADASSGREAGAPAGNGADAALEGGYVEPPRNVRVLAVERAELGEYLELSGTLRPARGADISAEESGVISQVLRDKGDPVRRGEAILSLDRRILAAEKESAEASEELNAFNEERTKSLFEENSVSGQEMLLVQTQAAQAAAQAEIARLRYEKASFPAPFAGIVSERFVEVGELVAPGTRVARIVDPYQLELVGAVSEREVNSIRKGATVEVDLDGLGAGAPGEVTWIGFEADPLTGKFPIEITVANQDLAFRPGILGRARIATQAHPDVIAIPRDAVIATNDGPSVFVVENGRARHRTVTLGFDQGSLVEVRSGLEPGDELVVRGHRDIADGSPVEIQERATTRDGSLTTDPISVRTGATPPAPQGDASGGAR